MAEDAFPPSLYAMDEAYFVYPPISSLDSYDNLSFPWQEHSTFGSADLDLPLLWHSSAHDPTYLLEAPESFFDPPKSVASKQPHIDPEQVSFFQRCETCDCGSSFTGRYTRGNLARHKRLKHYRKLHKDSEDGCTHRCVSFDVHPGDDWGGTHGLEPLDRKDHPPWHWQDMKETTSGARAAHSLPSTEGKRENARCCYALARVVHLRNVSRSSLMATLRRLETVSTSETDKGNTIKLEPCGVIYIHKRSWYHVTLTVTCIIGQLASCLAMHNYELRHSVPTTQCIPSATPTFFSDRLSRTWSIWEQNETALLKHYQNPSAFLFVCFGLLYGSTALLQYRLNRRDTHQYLSVPIGIVGGVVALAASTHLACGDGLKVASTLALCISIAMMLSVCVHGIWRTLLCPRTVRLQRKIEECMEECVLQTRGERKRMVFTEVL